MFPLSICLYAVNRVEFACYVLLIPRNDSSISNDMRKLTTGRICDEAVTDGPERVDKTSL
jgi:hypothetical protein